MIRNRNTIWYKASNTSKEDDKYVQLPKIANASLPTPVAIGSSGQNEGGIVYDLTNNALYFSDGSSWAEVGTGATGASKALSNLTGVAINTSLVSDADSTDDLGASSEYWANSYIDKMYVNATATIDGATAGKVDVTGNMDVSGSLVVDTNLTVTGTASIGTIQMDSLAATTTAETLKLDGDTTGGVNICSISSGGITLSDDTALASGKILTVAGTTAGTDYIVITVGSIGLIDGNLAMDEGKIEVDTTADETSYIKRNKSGGTNALLEIEATDTGDTGSGILIDYKGTGNAIALEIAHSGDYAAIDISAAAARTGNVINIPMADQLAETAIDISGAATGTSGEGIIHVDITGVMDGDAIRVDSTGANAATSSLFKGVSGGQNAAATAGIVAQFSDTGAAQATSYTVWIASTSNEALHVDTGEVQFDEALTLGVDATGADLKAFGDTTLKYMVWDESQDKLILTDATNMQFGGAEGTNDGVTMNFDGTADFDIDAVTANDNINFGSNVDTDVIFATAAGTYTIDHGANTLSVSADVELVVAGDAAGTGITGLVIPSHATATPNGAPSAGSIAFEIDAKKLWIYDGGTWVGVTLA